jgi:type IV pilus assembly protein PilV
MSLEKNSMYLVRKHGGFTLIEVLITLVIVAIGLLGLARLQMTSLNNQLEAYQRAQALFLLDEMANRIRVNSVAARAGAYADTTAGSEIGRADPDDEDCTLLTGAARDICDWNAALVGVAATLDGEGVGGLIEARGCIDNVTGTADGEAIIRLTIAWQGLSPVSAPAEDCGKDAFGDDELRRTATVHTVLAKLI